jgi:HK97 family phage major capsid protein
MKHHRNNTGILWMFSLLALVAVAFFAFGNETSAFVGGSALACSPFFPFRMLMDESPGLGGGGTLTPTQFQERTLDAIGKVREQQKTITDNIDKIDKDGKKLAEDFSAHVKTFDGLPNQVLEVTRTLSQLQMKIASERRHSFGSGVERISGDEELRSVFNGVVRAAYKRATGSEMVLPEEQQKGADLYARALSNAASPGTTLINAQLLPEIYSTIAEFGVWNQFDVMPVSTSSAKLIVDATDPLMYWQSTENTAPTESAITGSNVTATINKLLGWIQVSRELLEDAEVDLVMHLMRKFANATAYGLDWACLQADGGADATDGGFTGLFGGSATASVAASGNVSVATLDFEDFLNCMLAVNAAVLSRPTTSWIMHPQMVVRALSIKDLNGRPIFLPSIDAPAPGAVGSILGYPVLLAHGANATDGVSKRIAVFGDRMGQAVCLRKDFEWASSDQAKFTEDSIVFRARARGAARTKQALAFGALTTAAS